MIVPLALTGGTPPPSQGRNAAALYSAALDLRATSPRWRLRANTSTNPILGGRQHPAVWTGRLPGASSPVRWVTGEAIAYPSVTGEKMASSSHDGKNARTPATAAGSSDVGQDQTGEFLTTAQGLRLPDTDHSLKAGERGPTLLEDFHLREKITQDRKSTRLNSSHERRSRMPSSA